VARSEVGDNVTGRGLVHHVPSCAVTPSALFRLFVFTISTHLCSHELRPSASYDMLNDSYDVNGRQDRQVILRASNGQTVFPGFSICCLFPCSCRGDYWFLVRRRVSVYL